MRTLGACAYHAEQTITSRDIYDLLVEREEQNYALELERYPYLFEGVESIPGLIRVTALGQLPTPGSKALVVRHGEAVQGAEGRERSIAGTRAFVTVLRWWQAMPRRR